RGLNRALSGRCPPDAHDPRNWTVASRRWDSVCLTVAVPGSLLSGAHLPDLAPYCARAAEDKNQPLEGDIVELLAASSKRASHVRDLIVSHVGADPSPLSRVTDPFAR